MYVCVCVVNGWEVCRVPSVVLWSPAALVAACSKFEMSVVCLVILENSDFKTIVNIVCFREA